MYNFKEIAHMQDEKPDFWCRNEDGGISRPGKRRVVSKVTRSDIRVSAALANTGMYHIM